MDFKHWYHIQEQFDTVSDFILNPQHRDKRWGELQKEFEAEGGKILGVGKYGMVLSHPKWNYVLKIYNDEFYTRFVRYAYKNPISAFPKFYGPPQRVLPFYKRTKQETQQYLVRMEKLNPINSQDWEDISKNWQLGIRFLDVMNTPELEKEEERTVRNTKEAIKAGEPRYIVKKIKYNQEFYQQVIEAIERNPKLLSLFQGLKILQYSKLIGALDIHKENLMKRDNGDYVIVDPFWAGSNPYQDYDNMLRAEIDSFPEEEPELIQGGKFPPAKSRSLARKRKREREKLRQQEIDRDIPF